jgi:3-hydroxyisobutyrate dehydrogenase
MACKIAVNLYLIASVAALAEAAALAGALGLDGAVLERVIGSGPLGSDVSRAKLAKMVTGDFAPQAAIRDVCKNAALVAATAASAGLDASTLAAAKEQFDAVLAGGGGELDMAAVVTAAANAGAAG